MAGTYDKNTFSVGIAQKQWKVLNPDDLDEVVQIGLVDTGNVTLLGEKVFSLIVGGTGGPVPSLPSTIPPNPIVNVTGIAAALPTQALVNGVMIRAPGGATGNAGSVWIGGDGTVAAANGYELTPGSWVIIPTNNLNNIWIIGTPGDTLQWIGG